MIKPYILFSGNCAEAFDLYCRAFDGEIVRTQHYGDMPPNPAFPLTDDKKNLILHIELKLDETSFIRGCDSLSLDPKKEKNNSVCISVDFETEEKARKAWNFLIEEGSVRMELAPQFFAKLHGSLIDKYGIIWLFTVN